MNHQEALILKYFDHELTSHELIEFNHLKETDSNFNIILNQYAEIHNEMEQLPLDEPSPDLLSRFNTTLNEQTKKTTPKSSIHILNIKHFAYAASVALIVAVGVSLFSDHFISSFNSKSGTLNSITKNEHLVGLNDLTTTNRIEALNAMTKEKNIDQDVLLALIYIIENDKSPNVRLAAVEALSNYELNSEIKDAMLKQLTKESDDFVKISLIKVLAKVKYNRAIYQYDQLINNEENPKYIRDEAQLAKLQLNAF